MDLALVYFYFYINSNQHYIYNKIVTLHQKHHANILGKTINVAQTLSKLNIWLGLKSNMTHINSRCKN